MSQFGLLQQLRKDGEIEQSISHNFLLRNWPPAFTEWSTKSIRDAFFASPMFPKLLNGEQTVKDTIARGVHEGMLGYAGKQGDGKYVPFHHGVDLDSLDIEISDEMFVIKKETAEAYKKARLTETVPLKVPQTPAPTIPGHTYDPPSPSIPALVAEPDTSGEQAELLPISGVAGASSVRWKGQVPPQKWMNFYTKVLSPYAAAKGMKIILDVEVSPDDGLSKHQVDVIRTALRELGLPDDVVSSD